MGSYKGIDGFRVYGNEKKPPPPNAACDKAVSLAREHGPARFLKPRTLK
jgi:hypothetical protein